ncbi:MAG TPA: D-alanine--D-alanine ligase [Frankiaceae bacterium]|jgi:D-alanine-D-alanine ligase|nr:D-alanine--D-alanine ligase [Frankiaceae bacterium]
MRALILAGGLSFEREVSLRSGRRVCDALRSAGVEAEVRDADATLLATLAETSPDAVFVALHGAPGEDGAIRGVLDLAGVPYVGAAPHACRLAWDKPIAKGLLRSAGVATPDAVTLPHSTFRELGAHAVLERLLARLPLPLLVKPASGGSALGASIVRDADALPAAMVHCFSYGDTALVERLVTGTELAVSVVERDGTPEALPAVEVVPREGPLFDYNARYTAGATDYHAPARLPEPVLTAAARAALAAHRVLGLRDLSRTDLVVDEDGTPWFLEVNVSPGMTETSLLPMAAAAAGVDVGGLCRDLVAAAAARQA